MTLFVFMTVISGHDKPQPTGCLLEASYLAFFLKFPYKDLFFIYDSIVYFVFYLFV